MFVSRWLVENLLDEHALIDAIGGAFSNREAISLDLEEQLDELTARRRPPHTTKIELRIVEVNYFESPVVIGHAVLSGQEDMARLDVREDGRVQFSMVLDNDPLNSP